MTSGVYNPPSGSSTLNLTFVKDLTLSDKENFEKDQRKLLTRILQSSNIVASYGRFGPATTILVGIDILNDYLAQSSYFNLQVDNNVVIGNIIGMSVIVSRSIPPNKVIVMRVNKTDQPGLVVINNINDGTYFEVEVGWNPLKQFAWFEII